ncbi:MAG: hypothetical protein Wins2KO_12180 [Winogradskyella sp.]
MKQFKIIIIAFLSIFFSCSKVKKQQEFNLKKIDSIAFRRDYHGIENLSDKTLDSFLIRKPDGFLICKSGLLYNDLVSYGVIDSLGLNLKVFDTLPDEFSYQFSVEKQYEVKLDYLEYDESLDTPGVAISFKENNNIILIDTLQFGWPPDVIFSILDVNNDGKEELYTVYKNYIINGHNFWIDIYQLEEE